jgi:HEAT repeat protein
MIKLRPVGIYLVVAAVVMTQPGCRERPLSTYLSDLHSRDANVRRNAAQLLGLKYCGTHNDDKTVAVVVTALTEALDDDEAGVRQEAAETLGLIGERSAPAVPKLKKLLADPEARVRHGAAGDLYFIGQAAVPDLLRASRDQDYHMRALAIQALARIDPNDEKVITRVVDGLQDEDATVRFQSASSLGEIAPKARRSLPLLEQVARTDASKEVRRRAAWAIQKIGP